MKTNVFENISKLPIGYQVKLQQNGKETQIYFKDVSDAIKERNNHYQKGYKPTGIYLKVPKLSDCVKKGTIIQRSGNPVDTYQVHSRRIIDNKYNPRRYVSEIDAIHFAKLWLDSYLPVVSLYNDHQKKLLIYRARKELKTLAPHIQRCFNKALWVDCVMSIHGNNVPLFGKSELAINSEKSHG